MSENIYGFIYEKDENHIVTLTMDMNGPVNAMNEDFRLALEIILPKLEQESDLQGVVIASAKQTFFAGGDLEELSSVPKGEEENQFRLIEDKIKAPLRHLERLNVPVVAAINGAALGGGLELCLACNYRVAWNSASVIVGLPEVTLGLLPGGGGIVRSIHMLGLEKALPLLLEGTRLTADKAHEINLVDQLVEEKEDLIATAKDWILKNPNAWEQPWDQKHHDIPHGNIWNPSIAQTLSVVPAITLKKTRGLLPAPERILSVAFDTVTVDFDTALRIESRNLAYLITTPEAKNIITSTFFQMNRIKSGINRPKEIPAKTIKKVGVIGAGMMGQGIAYASAVSGIDVVLKDLSIDSAQKGKEYSSILLDKQIKRGKKTTSDKQAILDRILPTDSYDELKDCDLVIEAVFENNDLKSKVIQEAHQHLSEDCVFGSNTSTLPISNLAKSSLRPENFIGIHFFSPVEKMPIIEIICGNETSKETLAAVFDYSRQIKKTAIVVNDSLGFFTSRVFGTYMDEGARLLTEGLDPVLIDNMGKQVGMPVGPLTVQDEVSQELSKKAAETHREMGVFCSLGDNSCNAAVSETLINDYGRGGRHHGGGYYEYAEDGSKTVWPGLYKLYRKPEVDIPQSDIMDRILFRQVIESLKCLEEDVIKSVADGNVGSILAIGAPIWTGGFIQVVNTWTYRGKSGPEAFMDRCNELAKTYGERFLPPRILAEKVKSSELFL